MNKKRKIILISVISIVILLVIIGLVYYLVASNTNEENGGQKKTSEVSKLYETLKTKDVFSFELTLDDNNKMYYAKSGNTAYIDTVHDGTESKYIIRDGNSYLIVDNTRKYYTYNNNSANLNKVIAQLEDINGVEYQEGKEKIDGKNYNYEEYSGETNFAMGDFGENTEDIKTRFYFDGDNLVYIKTISGEKQELLSVNISYDVDQNLFQIPLEYKQA